VPLYQSNRATECADNELGCTISLKAAVLPGHQLTGPSEEGQVDWCCVGCKTVQCRGTKVYPAAILSIFLPVFTLHSYLHIVLSGFIILQRFKTN
jgi:hypothetical protein